MKAGDVYVKFNGELVRSTIKKMGLTMDKISTMVLGTDQSYTSKACNTGRINDVYLRKLCEFLSLNYDTVLIADVLKESATKSVASNNPEVAIPHLETLIVGMNTMYEIQKEYSATMKDLLVEIKALNAKQNRIENALGQLVQNSIITKENTNKICDSANSIRSQLNLANGRLKDLVDGVRKNEKTYKVV